MPDASKRVWLVLCPPVLEQPSYTGFRASALFKPLEFNLCASRVCPYRCLSLVIVIFWSNFAKYLPKLSSFSPSRLGMGRHTTPTSRWMTWTALRGRFSPTPPTSPRAATPTSCRWNSLAVLLGVSGPACTWPRKASCKGQVVSRSPPNQCRLYAILKVRAITGQAADAVTFESITISL